MTRAGLLNERLTVYTMTTNVDANGYKSVTLTLKGSYFCRVLDARNDRNDADVDRVVYNPERRFELRRQIAIADSDIIEYDGIKYVIASIERNKKIDTQTLNCERYEQ